MIESINFKLWITVEGARKKKNTCEHVLGLTRFKYVQGFQKLFEKSFPKP